ncbi:DUF1223 domain-containing protein [Jeongeupia naejangsanensis]|uniref:DUF1223 domain-containing protein n=1 Tax=Jeongeupia naejangsanensis TaxID=613195 RepID=A0ABS2BJM3_9NEIS|nr:DUF1223 domain-containing protein [Jeongeupia naejangsanensis]MBM3115794.1 DUF1223 domain-containing protein [Jeongeupia naejangsanensis]
MQLRIVGAIGLSLGALALSTLTLGTRTATPSCKGDSGPQKVHLVELYTSEGCSSCPPADARLNALDAPGVVPLALHVDYWDGLGWRDRFARREFGERQRWLVAQGGGQTVYTPHFFVDGQALFGWRDQLAGQLQNRPAAPLRLQVQAMADGRGNVHARIDSTAPGQAGLQLLVGVTEDGLRSRVGAGENRGATLVHDHVLRVLSPPLSLPAGGGTVTTMLPLPDDARAQLQVVAFVQDPRKAQIVQAVQTPRCTLR